MIQCTCGGATRVVDTGPHRGGVRRRRACRDCGKRMWTFECAEGRLPEPKVRTKRTKRTPKTESAEVYW